MKPGIYLVADVDYLAKRNLIDVVLQAVSGGVTAVQLRAKHLDGRAYLELATELKKALAGLQTPLLLNDRVDIALAAGVDGVHLGQSDLPVAFAREMLGDEAIIGVSVETLAEVEEANNLPVSYIAASPVFDTSSKMDTAAAWGLVGLARVCELSRHPVCAIGGLNSANLGAIRAAGVQYAAIISAICGENDPKTAAEILRTSFFCRDQEHKIKF